MSATRLLIYIRWLPALLWMAGIFYASSQQALPSPPGLSYTFAAMAGHFFLYFVLAALLLFALGESSLHLRKRLLAAGIAAFLYGLSDEFHQSFVPGREPTVEDLVVNLLGVLGALTVWAYWWRRTATS
jgi:VanZ family protein